MPLIFTHSGLFFQMEIEMCPRIKRSTPKALLSLSHSSTYKQSSLRVFSIECNWIFTCLVQIYSSLHFLALFRCSLIPILTLRGKQKRWNHFLGPSMLSELLSDLRNSFNSSPSSFSSFPFHVFPTGPKLFWIFSSPCSLSLNSFIEINFSPSRETLECNFGWFFLFSPPAFWPPPPLRMRMRMQLEIEENERHWLVFLFLFLSKPEQ